ncbi:hypothetical protein BZA02_1197 [Ruegeria sp. P4]|nr:hypothetical protein BZA02_1197 [Ruegeria sp. P4]
MYCCTAQFRVDEPTSAAGRYRSPFVNTAQAIRAITSRSWARFRARRLSFSSDLIATNNTRRARRGLGDRLRITVNIFCEP